MKKILFTAILLATTGAFSQVGIGTTNPQTTFHIDGAKDNAATGAPTTTQALNDFVVTSAGSVGIGNTDPKAALHISSTTSGVLLPRYTTAARTALTLTADQDGLAVYDTDEDCIFTYKHGSPATWISYCKVPFSIYAESNKNTSLGQIGATFTANSNNALNLPLTWTIESFSGDVSNVTIAANNPSTTATITYDIPNAITNNGSALIRIKAVDAVGQVQYTTSKLTTSRLVLDTPLSCNSDLIVNNSTLVNTKFNLFAKTSSSDAYITYIAPANPGNVNVSVTGDPVNALVDSGTGGVLKTWLSAGAGGTGAVTVHAPVYNANSSTFNHNPTLNFTAANSNALGIVTGNGSGAFKLVFLVKSNGGPVASPTIVSAVTSNSLGAAGSGIGRSWQVSRDDLNDSFIFRSNDSFVSKIFEAVSCPSCGANEVAFSTWSDFTDGTPHLVVVDYNGTSLKGYFDGVQKFEVTPNASNPPTGNQFRLGVNRFGSSFIDMELSELIIGNSTMTTEELITVQAYLLCKYGLDGSLLAYASPFGVNNVFYNSPSQFSLQIDGLGIEKVYDRINNVYYDKTNVPSPGLGFFRSPQIPTIQADNIVNVTPGPGANQLTYTRGDGTTFIVTVP